MKNLEREVRVLTWNIHGGVGLDFRHDIRRIGNILSRQNADIVALQEVSLRKISSGIQNTYEYLKKIAGKYSCHAWTIKDPTGNYGHILFSKFPMEKQLVHDVSIPNREPRAIIESLVNFPVGQVRVIALHMGICIGDKVHQLDSLREIILSGGKLPIIIMGDFNQWLGKSVENKLIDLIKIPPKLRTYPSFMPVLSLDRIMCTRSIEIVQMNCLYESWIASDHLPIVADIKLPK
jgi:endonuclease/exonuclease/phosphatase family metal-dependent hydrolase